MKCVKLDAPKEWGDSRGPDLIRWISDADLRFDGIENVYGAPTGHILGALSPAHWIIFHGLQTLQIIPDDVHSGWHYEYMDKDVGFGSVWKIIGSQWMGTFSQRHLEGQSHFIIRFYDDVIEVICKELLFGNVPFDLPSVIHDNPQMAFSYYQLAASLKKSGDLNGAIENYEKYQSLIPNLKSKDSVTKTVERLRMEGNGLTEPLSPKHDVPD